jgi:hypothetical protein
MDASEDSGTTRLEYDKLARVGMLGYRVTSQIDVMAGGHVHNLSYELTDSGNELAESSRGWFDPLLGGRFRWPISSRWQLRAAGHLGGLGIGSDLAWGLEGSIYYNVLSNLSVGLGYRFWAIDYSTGSADELFV